MKRLLLLALSMTTTAAFAQIWTEVGDAPPLLPGQITVGVGPLTNIVGAVGASGDADLYCIYIYDWQAFRATTVGQPGSLSDTQLFLFNANGMGVTHNDDSGGGARSTLTSQFLSGNGIYFIGITGYNTDPSSAGGLIWNNTPFGTERAPDGPGAGGSLASWAGSSSSGTYDILLNGATFHVPEPGTMAALGLGALALLRRRRKA